MPSSKASSQLRCGEDAPREDGKPSLAAQGSTEVIQAANIRSSASKGVLLTHHSVNTLSSLQELLRPTAASRIAAAARTVHMEEEAATATVGDGRSASAAYAVAGNTDPESASAAPLSSPPPYTATAISAASVSFPKSSGVAGNESSSGPWVPSKSAASTTVAAAAGTPSVPSCGPHADTISSPSTVPSLALLLECTKQLSALLAQWRACSAARRREAWGQPSQAPPPLPPSPSSASANTKGAAGTAPSQQQQQPARPSSERILQLMDIVLWYCLSTSDDVRLAHGGRSHGTSGRATPAFPGTATAAAAAGSSICGAQSASVGGSSTPYGVRGGGGHCGRVGSVGRSGSSSADPMGTSDWLGSRMSSSASSAVGVPMVMMTDDQVAEQLFRPAVDAVVLLQDRLPLPIATSHSSNAHSTDHKCRDEKRSVLAGPAESSEEDVGVELQTVALWMLAAVLVRFADAPLNATVFLPVLFPQADVRGANGAAARHPILQPLLRGPKAPVKRGSSSSSGGGGGSMSMRCGAAAVLTALLHKLKPTLQYAEEPHPNRQAFVSLATQCGTILLSLHEGLCWGLESEGGSAATPLLNTYAAVVEVTPYNRCPRSRAVILQALQLPVIRTYLTHEDWPQYVPTTVFASSVLKNESMRGAATQLLSSSMNANRGSGEEKKDDVKAVARHAGAKNARGKTERAAAVSSETLLSALLQHADTRVEVWRCMVPVSRLYPRMMHSEFDVLMSASVRVVAALTKWEAAAEAAEKAAFEVKTAEARETSAEPGNATPLGQRQQQQQQPSLGPPIAAAPTRVASDRAAHQDPSINDNNHNGEANDRITPGESTVPPAAFDPPSSSLLSRVRPPLTTPPETFAECLRTWLHFMGYVWKSFDDNACDPALSPACQQDRATLAQKQRIHEELLRPSMRLRRCGEEVRTMTLRCIAQIGDDYLFTLTNRSLGEELVHYAQTCIADPQPRVRGEALTTLGMWLWQYPSMDEFACVAIDNAVHSLMVDPNALVRTKAAFALSNVTGRLPEGTCPTVRDSPDYIATLCATAMHAAVIDSESSVQGHGIRMMNHLLQVLSFDELISEVDGFEEGVAEGFLRVLLECLRAATRGSASNASNRHYHSGADGVGGGAGRYATPREAKHRWNAACALGMGLARDEVFEAEPKYAVEAVGALCTAVVRDHIFKVRTQAAAALGRIPGRCLCASYSADDLTPAVVRSLCEALETATSTENFKQYKEQGSLHDALHGALEVMITTAKSSIELDKVFASYQKLLQKEKLL
ncbi:hypothetical protein ABL78_1845 [Leptomonas seymouri]|uniref:DUF4042 domain-containing protein n=1 Tax=Leptomonas seymouri TaxID=5684 RepID=A0A0N1I1M1_LEPSE|nr:hypothetical protein ABL78_1845 [Leptomonas seymouri]|eukprot:KPI89032.1 hypothetical protein ABL78_1845 [Leptomonas seymouri]